MRRGHASYSDDNQTRAGRKEIWTVFKSLWPYLMEYRSRVIFAFSLLILAKITTVAMPWALKLIVDSLDTTVEQLVAVPLGLLLLYGFFRFGTVFLSEARDAVFSRVTERAMRRVGLQVFQHLHRMDLEFHLSRQTGGISRDIDRGTTGITFVMRMLVFNILPTLFELAMVASILFFAFNVWFSLITLFAVSIYITFTILTTEWRNKFIRESNQLDSRSNTRAIDSLLNYETVKYFNNEAWEVQLYDKNLQQWEEARIKTRLSSAALNSGQALIISAAVTWMMIMAARDVVAGNMTLGDLVMINAYMIQLFIPLNFLGFVYREIRRALTDVENMFELLHRKPAIVDTPDAADLNVTEGRIEFDQVSFGYLADRTILNKVSFTVQPGEKVALVGSSGSGKSTIARLLFRFYDIDQGHIRIDGQDIQQVSQASLRRAIGVVPQDTVLFNESIWNNVAYGRPSATEDEIWQAIRMAHLDSFIASLPKHEQTVVGERGLKVSGGEKQRIAIARMLLKNPPILVFDEATSALDSSSERAILKAMDEVSENRTSLVIAHRLSTIVDADRIVVLEQGSVVESGSHQELLNQQGVYAKLWQLQQQNDQQKLMDKSPEI